AAGRVRRRAGAGPAPWQRLGVPAGAAAGDADAGLWQWRGARDAGRRNAGSRAVAARRAADPGRTRRAAADRHRVAHRDGMNMPPTAALTPGSPPRRWTR